MAEDKNYINLSIKELQEYIEKEYADVIAAYPIGMGERRAGIFLTTLEDGSLYLDTINIRPAAQGQGKGKEVLNILKNWADANKIAVYIKPAYLPDNPTFKGIETTPEKQVENLFNFYKNNGWEDNPNFTSLSPNEQSAQLSLSANAEWGADTDDLYSPLVYTPEGVDIPELPKNPYINDIISTAEKFNIDGKAFVDGYNQPILDETIQGILKIEPFYGLSGYGLEVDEWKKSEFSRISDILVEQGINPSDIEDISKYIPRDKILTPAQIFQGNMRNEYFTDEIVEMLKEDVGGFYELDDAGDELSPQNRPKRNHKLYYIISQGDDVGGKLYADYVRDISGPFNKTPEPTKWVEYLVNGERSVDTPDTPTNVVDDFFDVVEDIFKKYEIANKGKELNKDLKTGTTLMSHSDFIPELASKYNLTEKETEDLIMIVLDNQVIDDDIPYMVSRNTFKDGSNVADSVKKYINGEKIIIDKTNYFHPQHKIFGGTYQRKLPDTPGGSVGAAKLNDPLVFDSWVDNLGRTTTSFVDNLPLETVVKNRVKNLITTKTKQLAKPGSLVVKAVDAWEFGVIGLMAAGIAFNEIDEVPKIINNTAINMFNSMTAPYGIAPVKKEEYDIDYEFINTVLDTGSKVMPTDIIIEKLKPYSLEEGEDVILPGTGVTATTGAKQQFEPYGEELAKRAEKTVNMKRDEVKQDLLESKGVQEEKMFKQAKPKKSKATGGAGAKIL